MMRFLESSNSLSFLAAATLLFAHVSLATPTCSNITDVTYDLDTKFSNTSGTRNTPLSYQPLDQLICPTESTKPCSFDRGKAYNLTANRYLSFSNLTSVTSTEAEKIYLLSHDAWQSGFNGTTQPFIVRTAVLNSSTLDQQMLDVQPGMNVSLGFDVYYMKTRGTLGGCANETLNGVKFQALVPYLDKVADSVTISQGQKVEDGKVLAGVWEASGNSVTGTNPPMPIVTKPADKKNSGNRFLGGGQVSMTIGALLVVMLGFGML